MPGMIGVPGAAAPTGAPRLAADPPRGARDASPAALLASVGGGLALVLVFRTLYLSRFGYEPGWMNVNFLLEAKAERFGYATELRSPLVRMALLPLRDAGASAALALGALYGVGHLLLALGTFGLARKLFAAPVSRAAIAVAVAAVPTLATDSGYHNLSCTLGAGLFAAVAALLLADAARAPRLRLAAALVLGAAAASCRPEAAIALGGLAVALAVRGPRLGMGRAGAVVAALSVVVGLAATRAASHAAPGPDPWAFYTWYEAPPLLHRLVGRLREPGSTASEYARYVATARTFGGFDENAGSLARALGRHPAQAAVWLAAKPLDVPATLLLPSAFTPLIVVALLLAGRRAAREGWRQSMARFAPALAAFAAPLGFLLVFLPFGHAPYLLIVAPLFLLAAVWGLEPWLLAASVGRVRLAGAAALATGAIAVLLIGPTASSSPARDLAARWLERQCATGGCLVNAVPQGLDARAWADLRAGAPLPPKDKRTEPFIYKRYTPSYIAAVSFRGRVAAARARGSDAPVLYLRLSPGAANAFSDDFDPEHRLEGEPDLRGAVVAASFGEGTDVVQVLQLPGPGPD